jgi:hypothetical protein
MLDAEQIRDARLEDHGWAVGYCQRTLCCVDSFRNTPHAQRIAAIDYSIIIECTKS